MFFSITWFPVRLGIVGLQFPPGKGCFTERPLVLLSALQPLWTPTAPSVTPSWAPWNPETALLNGVLCPHIPEEFSVGPS